MVNLLRRSSILLSAGLALMLVAAVGLFLSAGGREPVLAGTVLDGRLAADFQLVDQRGEDFQLSELRGDAVALTFIFTNCPDVCPVIAQKLRIAYEQLPEQTRDNVALVAVTVDPERDSPAALQAFSERHGLADNPRWFALTGSYLTLEQVWSNYFIDPGHAAAGHVPGHPTGGGDENYMLPHTDAVFFIDPDGGIRALMRADADPADIAANLKALAH